MLRGDGVLGHGVTVRMRDNAASRARCVSVCARWTASGSAGVAVRRALGERLGVELRG